MNKYIHIGRWKQIIFYVTNMVPSSAVYRFHLTNHLHIFSSVAQIDCDWRRSTSFLMFVQVQLNKVENRKWNTIFISCRVYKHGYYAAILYKILQTGRICAKFYVNIKQHLPLYGTYTDGFHCLSALLGAKIRGAFSLQIRVALFSVRSLKFE